MQVPPTRRLMDQRHPRPGTPVRTVAGRLDDTLWLRDGAFMDLQQAALDQAARRRPDL